MTEPSPSSGLHPRSAVIFAGALLLGVSLLLFLIPRDATVPGRGQTECGSAIAPEDQLSEDLLETMLDPTYFGSDYAGACDSVLNGMRTWAFVTGGLGLVTLVTLFLVAWPAGSGMARKEKPPAVPEGTTGGVREDR